jgi:outer membrane protein OmpA-like peptidoglycan-associated protein
MRAPATTHNAWRWASELKISLASLLWGIIAMMLAFTLASEFHQGSGRARGIDNVSVHPAPSAPAPIASTRQSPFRQELQAVSSTPPEAPSARFPLPVPEARPAFQGVEANTGEAGQGVAVAEPGAQIIPTQRSSAVGRSGPDTRELRTGLLEQLNGVIPIRDTAQGLVVTVPDSAFSGADLHSVVSGQLAHLVTAVLPHPGLRIDVQGNSETGAGEALSSQRAEAVRQTLLAQGLPNGIVTARGLGDAHPFGPNTSVAGRAANRRVEVVISGDPIGDLPLWEHPYALMPGP